MSNTEREPIAPPPDNPLMDQDIAEFKAWYKATYGKDYDFARQYDAFQAWRHQANRVREAVQCQSELRTYLGYLRRNPSQAAYINTEEFP